LKSPLKTTKNNQKKHQDSYLPIQKMLVD